MTVSDGRVATSPQLTIVSPPEQCAYLEAEQSSYEIRVIPRLRAEQYDAMLQRGWRRQGAYFFRPSCPACDRCKSLRVRVPSFRPTKSQRRCRNQNPDIDIEVGAPTASNESIDLFNAYHADMSERRGWRENQVDVDAFAAHFLVGDFPFAREYRYYSQGRLVGVGLVDVTKRSSSSIYFFHAPDWRPRGPGVFSMLTELEHATSNSIPYHYLGYWIAECSSMAYKNRYRPHEILDAYVSDQEEPVWIEQQSPSTTTS